jgi:hypothetical protein
MTSGATKPIAAQLGLRNRADRHLVVGASAVI